jgi:hypothetical protein
LREHIVYKELIPTKLAKEDTARILLILANFIYVKVNKRKHGHFSVEEEYFRIKNLAKEIYTFLTLRGFFILLLIVIVFFLSVLLSIYSDIFVGFWKTNYFGWENKGAYMSLYAILAFLSAVIIIMRDLTYRRR